MTAVKKYWWVILVILAMLAGFMLKNIWTTVDNGDISRFKNRAAALLVQHKADSIRYARKNDSLITKLEEFRLQLQRKDGSIVELRNQVDAERSRIMDLTAEEGIEYFSDRTCEPARMVAIDGDTTAVISKMAIRKANDLFITGDGCCMEKDTLEGIRAVQDSVIMIQSSMIEVKDSLIIHLNQEFNIQKDIVQEQQSKLKQYKKKTRNKNILVGAIGVIAGLFLVVSIAK